MNADLDADDFIVRSTDPLNAEPVAHRLIADYLTPQSLLYVRSHGAIPSLPADHAVAIAGAGPEERHLTRADLEGRYPVRTIVATMQCAGNRRAHLQSVRPTRGDPWAVGAIGTVAWTGVSLADVLRDAGIGDRRDGHVACTSADRVTVEGEEAAYGISITLGRAMAGDVLIAWAANGEPLAPPHGAPLRLVVPGYAGVRSAKWLTRIAVQDRPSDAPIQARDYKLFPPEEDGEGVDWARGLTIEAMPVTSAICVPGDGDVVPAGPVAVQGYAVAYGRGVARVEVSGDGGASWRQAELLDAAAPDAWRRWTATVALAPGRRELVVRAVDDAGQGQPSDPAQVWNFAGYLSAAWHRVAIEVR